MLTGITLLLGLLLPARSQEGNRMNDLDRQISDLEQFLKSSDHLQQSRNDKASVWSNLGETWSSYYFGSGRSKTVNDDVSSVTKQLSIYHILQRARCPFIERCSHHSFHERQE